MIIVRWRNQDLRPDYLLQLWRLLIKTVDMRLVAHSDVDSIVSKILTVCTGVSL